MYLKKKKKTVKVMYYIILYYSISVLLDISQYRDIWYKNDFILMKLRKSHTKDGKQGFDDTWVTVCVSGKPGPSSSVMNKSFISVKPSARSFFLLLESVQCSLTPMLGLLLGTLFPLLFFLQSLLHCFPNHVLR